MADLELPFIASIPYSVQIDDSLSDGAKLYFGQIVGLSRKYGYIFATDEALAKMKNVNIRNIERWNKALEDAGHITRETQNVPERDDSGKWIWKKKRKIYVTEGFSHKKEPKEEYSNKDCGTAKNGGTEETAKNGGTEESAKNGGYNKTLLNKHLETNKQEQVFVCSPIGENQEKIFSLLESHEFPDEEIRKLYNLPFEQINLAVKAYEQQLEKGTIVPSPIGWIKKAIENKWKPNETVVNQEVEKEKQEQQDSKIKSKNKKFTEETVRKHEEKFSESFKISVNDSTALLKNGVGYSPLNLLDKDFESKLSSYVKLKIQG